MDEAITKAKQDGITRIIFGDLFLADIRDYREQKLAGTGMTPVFPLWGQPTLELAQAMTELRNPGREDTITRYLLQPRFARGALRIFSVASPEPLRPVRSCACRRTL